METKEEVGKVKDMLKPKDNSTFKESLRRKLEVEEEIGKDEIKEREKVKKGRKHKNNNLKEEIEKRVKSIEKDIIYTQMDSLTELTKKMKILNTPLEIDRKRDIAVLNTTELLDNEKNNRNVRNTICHKCKGYGHTKKQCDRHNKNIKCISKLDFQKDVINELMEIFKVSQKEISQVKEKKELKSTNPLKFNKRKRKQKDIIMKLMDNLPNHLRDRKDYLLKLKDSIDIPITCIKCRKYGHHVIECRKKEREKTKKKQDKVDIKPVTLQDLMTKAKMVKQEIKEIKEDNSTDINKQNIVEIINLKEFSKPMIEPPSLEKDNNSNRQNILSFTNEVIFQKRDTETINKEFLTEVVETDSMNERLIPFKRETEFEELTQANKEKLINDHIGNEGVKSYDLRKDILFNFILPLNRKEISFLIKVTILKDVNKERTTCSGHLTEKHLIENSLDEHLTDDDIKRSKQDIETEIFFYSPFAFLHEYQHKVQSPRVEELSTKGIKDRNMDAIFYSQYAWTNNMIEVPNKIIVNNIFTPFIVSLHIHLTDILIKEALTDSPLLIKENINCGNFLNDDRFNFLTDSVHYNPLTDFPINKRLYKETLFHIFSQDEIYSNTYIDRIILDFKNILNLTYFDRPHHDCSNTTITQQEHKRVHRDVCFIIYT